MDAQIQKIKNFLLLNKDYSKYSFYKDPVGIIYINLIHLKTWGLIENVSIDIVVQANSHSYVSIQDSKILLSDQNNVRKVEIVDFLEAFELLTTVIYDGIQQILTTKIPISKQYCFAYTIFNFLQSNYPELEARMEYEIFKVLGIRHHTIKGPRIDIYIKTLSLAIEFDEGHHNTYENKFSDSQREKFLIGYGLNVIRCSENEDIAEFIKTKLVPQIKFLDTIYGQIETFGSKIIDDLVESGCGSREKIGLLVNEQMLDIIESKRIGEQIRNITLRANVLEWLQIDDDDQIEKIHDIIDGLDSDEPVEQMESDKQDYFLSPNAFYAILDRLDGMDFTELYLLRKSGNKIRHRLLQLCAEGFIKIKSISEKQNLCISTIGDYHYERGRKDLEAEIRKKEKENNELKGQINSWKKIIDKYFPYLKPKDKKIIKTKSDSEQKFCLIPGNVISEELDIIYTGNSNDRILVDEIKHIHEIRSRSYKIKSYTKCIDSIRSRLGICKDELTPLSSKCIFKCADRNTYENNKIKEYTDHKYKSSLDLIDSDEEIVCVQSNKTNKTKKSNKKNKDFIFENDSSDDSEI